MNEDPTEEVSDTFEPTEQNWRERKERDADTYRQGRQARRQKGRKEGKPAQYERPGHSEGRPVGGAPRREARSGNRGKAEAPPRNLEDHETDEVRTPGRVAEHSHLEGKARAGLPLGLYQDA